MIKLSNYARLVEHRNGQGWYHWVVFVDESPEVLQQISSVEYELHPTFPEPRQIRTDPLEKFAVETSGWGEFTILATITFRDGTRERIPYPLDLSKAWPERAFA